MTSYHDPVTVRDLQEQLAVERAENGRLRAEMDRLRAVASNAADWLEANTDKVARRFHASHIRRSLRPLWHETDSALSASGEKENR